MSGLRKLKLEELNRLEVEAYRKVSKIPLVIILDNIRSGLNVGSVFRTSDAFKVESVILTGITAKPPHKEILKTAIGANESVEWEYYVDIKDAISVLQKQDYIVVGIEQTTESIALQNFQLEENNKYALIFGNEVRGISEDILMEIDLFLEIPQYGTKHSLNISVCAGIVIHYFAQKLLQKVI